MLYKRRQGSDLAAQSRCPVYVACGLYVIGCAYGSMFLCIKFSFYMSLFPFRRLMFYIAAYLYFYYIIKIASSKNNLQILRSFFNF